MDFSRLKGYIDNIDKNLVPSCRIIVCKGKDKVFEHFSAREDVFETEKDKQLYYLFSMTKVITNTAAMRLVQDGKLKLDDPVSLYLPEFSELYVAETPDKAAGEIDSSCKKAESTLTVKHLMTMQGGFTYNLSHPEIRKAISNGACSTRDIVSAMAKMPLIFEPGTNFEYSLCHDILGAVIEVCSGMSLYDYMNSVIFSPLGMKNTYFQPRENTFDNMHQQYTINKGLMVAAEKESQCIYSFTTNYESGGAGLISSAEDYSRFVSCLAAGSDSSGYSIISREMIDIMRQDHLSPQARKAFGARVKPGYSYGLGVRTLLDKELIASRSPIGEYGWDGAAGSYNLIDPENGISIVYTQHVLGCGYAFDLLHPTIKNLTYEAFGIE